MSQRSKFIAYIDQTNYGCDYTIAYGKTFWELKAETYEERRRRYEVFKKEFE